MSFSLFLSYIRLDALNPFQYLTLFYSFFAYRNVHAFTTSRTILMMVLAVIAVVILALTLFIALIALVPGVLSSLAS
jgi:sterol desaturase/sphingolipid hydroxylase (fatty acid hydroxylase superfamily)